MIKVVLPDGSIREYMVGITGGEIAAGINARLAKDAVAILIDGILKDLTCPITQDAKVKIITRDSEEGLEILRHDGAHVMAEAVKELYPETQVTIGPAIENGFYYDFHRQTPFTLEDLENIEARMHEIVDRDEPIIREVWSRHEAVNFFKNQGEHFKAEIVASIPDAEDLSVYRQGQFVDLCRGPHLPSTGHLGHAFKLMKLAGAYWRGDAKNPQLQRIYGTVWADEKGLKAYLKQLEEAEKRDHRRLGREMQLFHQQEEAPGDIFWHPRGWQLYRSLQDYIRERLQKTGYIEVRTPQLLDRRLWERSGHWEKFRENMFVIEGEEGRSQVVKPMNCPCHIEIFRQGIKSYRDLPIRMAEFGSCHRNESSGSLHGIMRVRAMVQDDAHIFCTPDQIITEARSFCALLKDVYKDLGLGEIMVKFSDRPPVRAGSDDIWDKAEEALRQVAEASGLTYKLNPGEGAFYGPKLEFIFRDAIGRDWQCGTLQVDLVLPERLDASYIGEDGEKHHPVMLHRAILGSLERFIGVLLEHYAGRLPLWLAPLQAVVAPITNELDSYAQEVAEQLKGAGLRVELDTRNEKISYKIRELSVQKIPLIVVVGKREAQERTVAIRRLGSEAQEVLALDTALAKLGAEASSPLMGSKAGSF